GPGLGASLGYTIRPLAAVGTPDRDCRSLLSVHSSLLGHESVATSVDAARLSSVQLPAPMHETEVAIIGGGIVGLATAYHFTRRFPGQSLVLLEKEPELAAHQTGRNSGVLHSGIYYKPGSLRARNCRQGKEAMQQFCADEGVDF